MKKYFKYIILFILITIAILIYFNFPIVILRDSSGYLSYLDILDGTKTFNDWNPIRGIIFPLLIYISTIFGRNVNALKILSFVFFVILNIGIYGILINIFDKKMDKNFRLVLITFILILLFLNPMIFGYYHSLLTEFVAMTISILSCLFAYLWLNKVGLIRHLISIIFIIMLPVAWHLKQPYAICVFLPLLLAGIISIINKHKLKNILYATLVLVLSLIMLFVSIKTWSYVVRNYETTDTVDNLSGYALFGSLRNVKWSNINDDNMYYRIATVKKANKGIGKIRVNADKSYNININNSVAFMMKYISKYPGNYVNDIYTNYMLASDTYHYTDVLNDKYETKFKLNQCFEICDIGYRFMDSGRINYYYLKPGQYTYVKDYTTYNNSNKFLVSLYYFPSIISKFSYSIIMLLLPLLFIGSVVIRIINKNKDLTILINMNILLSGYSFFHVLIFCMTSSIIDRYQLPAYVVALIAYIAFGYLLIKLFKKKNELTL